MAERPLHAAAYAGRQPDAGGPLFTETVAFSSEDERAVALRRRIMRRPIDPAGNTSVRQVLLSYTDGAEHLIVSRLGAETEPAPAPDWAVFDAPAPARTELSQPCEAATRDLTAAVAIVLSRYSDTAPVVGTPEGKVTFEISEEASREGLRGRSRPAEEDVPAAVVVVDADPRALDEWRGDPVAPIEMGIDRGRLRVRYREDVHPAAAGTLLHAVIAVLAADEKSPVGGIAIADSPAAPVLIPIGATENIVSAVARQCALRPDAVAVSCGDEKLTYRELVSRARIVSVRLAAAGVGRGDRVGVSLEPSVQLVVNLMGVLTSGAAYVPLDPGYPPARLEFMAQDAGLAAVIDGDTGEADQPTMRTQPPAIDADDDAYVIYTSGSTGKPKGVVATHRNVLSLVAATADFAFGPDDVWTMFHSYAFDFSVWEIWGCLTTGGRLVVVPRSTARDPHAFHRLLIDEQVTVLNQTPSAFAQLSAVDDGYPLAVRLLIFGGEPLDVAILRRWIELHPEQRLFNMYGITETTVHCTWKEIDQAVAAGSRSVGRALRGWSVSVRDAMGRPLPLGVPGEICVEGAGLTRGYLGLPALTAQRFPASDDGRRHYRSGDKGRLRPDGELEHLGRIDEQVKVSGYRVELGEVRAALLGHPEVTAAAVVARRRDGSTFLAAYVVGARADPAVVRRWLADRLPEHCLPRDITVIDQLPTTVNGKLDVDRLPDPPTAGLADGPSGSGEPLQWVIGLWRDLLGKSVAADDNFFLLGGTSLLAFKTVIAAREAGFGEITVRDMYRHPVPRSLAALLKGVGSDASE